MEKEKIKWYYISRKSMRKILLAYAVVVICGLFLRYVLGIGI